MSLEIAIAARAHDRKGVAPSRRLDLHFLDGLLQGFGVVERADIDAREAAKRIGVQGSNAGLKLDRPYPILLAFLDLESYQKTLAFRIVFRQRGHHLNVGEAMLQIKAANQVTIGLDPVRIVCVSSTEETQEIGFARLDDIPEAIRRISIVADEFDRLDAGFRALGNGENEIDAVVRLFDDFGIDAHVIAAGAAIDLGDTLGVGLDHGTRQRAARLGLDFRGKLLVLDLLVALERHAADHRVFDHRHQQATARLTDFDVLEQACLDQRFQAVIDTGLIETPAGTRLEIGANGLDLDAAIALDLNRRHGLGDGWRRNNHGGQRRGHRHSEHDQGG